ncbi:hypothetical protein RFI_28690, partial [Reticulomyxa filosa]
MSGDGLPGDEMMYVQQDVTNMHNGYLSFKIIFETKYNQQNLQIIIQSNFASDIEEKQILKVKENYAIKSQKNYFNFSSCHDVLKSRKYRLWRLLHLFNVDSISSVKNGFNPWKFSNFFLLCINSEVYCELKKKKLKIHTFSQTWKTLFMHFHNQVKMNQLKINSMQGSQETRDNEKQV